MLRAAMKFPNKLAPKIEKKMPNIRVSFSRSDSDTLSQFTVAGKSSQRCFPLRPVYPHRPLKPNLQDVQDLQ